MAVYSVREDEIIINLHSSEVKGLTKDTHSSLIPVRIAGWTMTEGRADAKNTHTVH